MKKSGSQVENVYYLDSSCANASTSGADERVTAVCGQLLARGQVILAKGHDYQDGKCTACGAEDPNYQPEQPTQPENPGVKTGDESYVVLWSAALLLGGAALVLLPRKKRS
ncbi:MAG: LPXTG cell wall anchor domain-containing protein [Oscillospiraceae bacterium]